TATRTITPPLSTGPSIETTVGEAAAPAPARRSRVAAKRSRLRGRRTGIRRDPPLHPARQHALRHLLRDEGEGVMVAPVPVDVDVAAAQSLIPEAELLDDTQARAVLRADADLHPMQPEPLEAGVGRHRDRGRRDPPSGEALADPVADGRRAQRPPGDAPDVELPSDLAVVLHHERIPGAVTMLLQQAADADAH